MNTRALTFRKPEKLCSRDIITKLFEDGNNFYTPAFRVVWRPVTSETGSRVQVAFSVQKKSFRKAVDRNLLKRRLREAYRHEKQRLYEHLEKKNLQIAVMLIYRHSSIKNYSEISQSVAHVIEKLVKDIDEKLSLS